VFRIFFTAQVWPDYRPTDSGQIPGMVSFFALAPVLFGGVVGAVASLKPAVDEVVSSHR